MADPASLVEGIVDPVLAREVLLREGHSTEQYDAALRAVEANWGRWVPGIKARLVARQLAATAWGDVTAHSGAYAETTDG